MAGYAARPVRLNKHRWRFPRTDGARNCEETREKTRESVHETRAVIPIAPSSTCDGRVLRVKDQSMMKLRGLTATSLIRIS